jgi:uncharacterized SAM-binding protein YcdF (DUF218 family)
MAPAPPAARSGAKHFGWKWKLALLITLAALTAYVTACVLVARERGRDELRPADAIVVFGAAEYAGRPSPIFKARLDHAFDLYQRGLAPVIIVTGGAGDDPQFSEGGVGRDYLIRRGVPEISVIAETQSENTGREAERVATIMRVNGMRTCLAVSDWYHMYRSQAALRRYGVTPYSAPRPETRPETRQQRLLTIMREALSTCGWWLRLT